MQTKLTIKREHSLRVFPAPICLLSARREGSGNTPAGPEGRARGHQARAETWGPPRGSEGQRRAREAPSREGRGLRSPARVSQGKHTRELPGMSNTFPWAAGAAVPRLPATPPPRRGGFTARLRSGHGRSPIAPAGEALLRPGASPALPIQFRPGAAGGGGGGGLRARPAGPGEEPLSPLPPRVLPGVTGAGRARRSHHQHLRNLSGGSQRSAAPRTHRSLSARVPEHLPRPPRRPPQP